MQTDVHISQFTVFISYASKRQHEVIDELIESKRMTQSRHRAGDATELQRTCSVHWFSLVQLRCPF